MTWNKSLPTTGSKMVDTATIYPDNWVAIEEWVDTDHYTFTNSLSGKHRQGETAVMSAATTSVVTSATLLSSNSGSGAIGWSTDRGHLLLFLSGGWGELPKTYQEGDVSAYQLTQDSFTGALQQAFDEEENDPYSQYVGSTGWFTATKTGKYLVSSSFSFSESGTYTDGNPVSLVIQSLTWRGVVIKTLSGSTLTMGYTGSNLSVGGPKYSLEVVGCFSLSATDRIRVYIDTTSTVIPSGGSGVRTSFLSIKRIE